MLVKLIKRNDDALESRKQFNEAFDEARDVLIDNDLYTEAFGNSILNKIKSGLQKVCPSPEKIKDFMAKYAKRIDDKLKSCKEKWFVDAWNNLKNLAQNIDNKQANESFAMYLESIGEDLNSREQDYSYLTDESLYEEGFFDKLKNGVKAGIDAFKNSGQSQNQGGKNNNQNTTKKQSSNNKPTKLGQIIQQNGWSQKDALKPENVKKIAAALKKSGNLVPDMVKKYFASNPQKQNPSNGNKNNNAQSGDANKQGKINGQAILQFMKKHWKMIAIILIAAIGFMWGGPMVGAKFLVGPTIRQACKLVGGNTGALLGTVGAVGATMAMGVDGDVDADVQADVDSDADVDSGDTNADTNVDGDSGVKDDLNGDGDHDSDDLASQRGNKDWLENLSDKDKTAISKTFNSSPDIIAGSGYASMTHGGDDMLIHADSSGGFTANVGNIEYVHIDNSGNLVDMDGKPLDFEQVQKQIAASDPRDGILKAKMFANGYYGLQHALKTGALQAIKNMN